MLNDIKNKIKKFYFNELIPTFDVKSHQYLTSHYQKFLWEVETIVRIIEQNNIKEPSIIDAGGGLGIPSIILSKIFQYNCSIIDRYDEFDESFDRKTGGYEELKNRLLDYSVKIHKDNFIDPNNKNLFNSFDIVTNFSVIEHLILSPNKTINSLSKFLKNNGILFLTTPNQAHAFNRIKLLFGYNVWEDIKTFQNDPIFYGHVREYLLSEIEEMTCLQDNLKLIESGGTNYPIISFINKKIENSVLQTILSLLLRMLTFSKYLKLQIYITAKKIT